MDFDRELPDIGRLLLEAYEEYSAVIEALSLIGNDSVSRAILMVLFAAPGPMGGEELYRRVRELGVNVSRAAFHRRLKRLVESGIVLALGNPSNKTRKGPYILLPAYKEIITETTKDLKELTAIEKMLLQDACKFIQSLEEGNLGYAFYYLDKLEEYYKQQGARIFWTIMASFLRLAKNYKYKNETNQNILNLNIQTKHNSSNKCTCRLQKEAIMRGLLISLIPYVIITQFTMPIKIFYRTMIKEECQFL